MAAMEWIVPFAVLLPFVLLVLVAGSGRRAAADHHAYRLGWWIPTETRLGALAP